MKSKKMLAQIAAFSLVFGMTGVVSSWADNTAADEVNKPADEVVVDYTTVKQFDPLTGKPATRIHWWIQLRMAACPLLVKM